MHPFNVIRCSIVCAVLYFVSAAPPSTSTLNHHATTSIASSTTQPPHVGTTSANISDSKTALEIVSDLSAHHPAGPRFLADTGDGGDLSNNEAYYLGVILLGNAVVFFGVVFYLLIPWMRMCSWFNNCKYNGGQGYYPSGLGHSMDDAARMLNTFNLPYDRFLSKRSLEYVAPVLKTIAEAYDKYESSSPAKEE